jgi:nucleotide-binding universal stress UspA family protein
MTLLVPFDGSELAEAALVRATEFATVFDEDVLAVCVIPEGNAPYAKEREWIAEDDRYDIESVVSNLHEQVVDLAPSADFRHKRVDKYALQGPFRPAFETSRDRKTCRWSLSEATTRATW